jgi:hypothetical protein
MEHNKKEIKRALLTCVPYLIVVFFLDDLDRFFYLVHSRFGNTLVLLYLIVATVIILSLLIHEFIDFKQSYVIAGYWAVLPLAIYIIATIDSFWSPVHLSSNVFRSKTVYQAFRKAQNGHDQMRFRYNGSIDIRYTGIFGSAEWEYGHWKKNADTFYINYDGQAEVKPDTLVLRKDGLLAPVGIPVDTLALYKDRFFRLPQRRKK